jgi:hypothetical protein
VFIRGRHRKFAPSRASVHQIFVSEVFSCQNKPLSIWSTSSQQNAAAISQWPQVNKQAFANGLIERINDPNRIDQAGTPLCGPSTLLRSLDMANPDAYARAGIDLYTTGTCRINNLTITPGRELKAAAVPSNTNPADWVLLCSIRDSSNWFLSPAGWFGNNLAGVTIPSTIEGWFRSAGYTHIINDTSLTGGDIPVVKSMCAQRASQRFGEGYNVAMLIDADMLEPDTQGDWVSMYPTTGSSSIRRSRTRAPSTIVSTFLFRFTPGAASARSRSTRQNRSATNTFSTNFTASSPRNFSFSLAGKKAPSYFKEGELI